MPRAKRPPKPTPEIPQTPAEQGAIAPPAMTGSSLTYLKSIYNDTTLDIDTRMDAAKTALPYEHAKAATDTPPAGEDAAIKITILRFGDRES